MPHAARVGDPTNHPGAVAGPGCPTVLIGGVPAAVQGDNHACTMPAPSGPHPPTPFAAGSTTVFIGGRPAQRVGDIAGCGAAIVTGLPSVEIGG